jgi:acyl CoA:acetate/3-ketoacid CoA transferase beta subunit
MLATATELGVVTFDGMNVLGTADVVEIEVVRAITEERLDRLEQANRQRNH